MPKYLIVGGGPASFFAIKAIRKRDSSAEILLVGDEPKPLYFRAALSGLLTQQLDEKDLDLSGSNALEKYDVKFVHDMARSLDTERKVLTTLTGYSFDYDKMLIATGASPKIPVIEGRRLKGVHTLRSIQSALEIGRNLNRKSPIVIIGAGVLGLEVAYAAASVGATPVVICRQDHVGFPMLDKKSSVPVLNSLIKIDVKLILSDELDELIGDGEKLVEVRTKKGELFLADQCVICTGVAPNVGLAHGTTLYYPGGFRVDEMMRTAKKDVFAAGDCCEFDDPVTGERAHIGHWRYAALQGEAAGANMAGENIKIQSNPFFNAGTFFDLPYFACGNYKAKGDGRKIQVVKNTNDVFIGLVFNDDVIEGALSVGESAFANRIYSLIKSRARIGKPADSVFTPEFESERYMISD